MIVMGIRGRDKYVGMPRLPCPGCGQDALHRIVRSQPWFTLFFVPVFPFRSRYISTCNFCGLTQRIDARAGREYGKESGAAGV
jgi:hypothetical protein